MCVLLLCVDSQVQITLQNQKKTLKKNDILLINPKESFEIEKSDAKVVLFEVDRMEMQRLFMGRTYHFHCDSTEEINDNYDILRRLLTDYLLIFYEDRVFKEIEKQQKSSEILLFLVHHFSPIQRDDESIDRATQIRNYIIQNSNEEMSLEDIADAFHMTPQYFSKYFKKTMGETFYKYLNRVRVDNAIVDLTYQTENITYIAFKNGFANTNAFLKYFKEFYHMTPQEYQKSVNTQLKEDQKEVVEELRNVFENEDVASTADHKRLSLKGNVASAKAFIEPWKEMINFKDASRLLDYSVREQVEYIQNAMAFSYIRTDLKVPQDTSLFSYSFYKEEEAFDYLYHLHLNVWFGYWIIEEVEDWSLTWYVFRYITFLFFQSIQHWKCTKMEIGIGI